MIVHGEDAHGQTCLNCGQPAKAWEPCVAPSPTSLDGEKVTSKLDIDRVAAFLHDEYGCRMSCRGGRLANDRHPSHNEAYRDQAERLVAALGDGHE